MLIAHMGDGAVSTYFTKKCEGYLESIEETLHARSFLIPSRFLTASLVAINETTRQTQSWKWHINHILIREERTKKY
jgi:hypothetical protein